MNIKIALITGTSSGFGLHTAIGLAKENFHVIATMRDLQKKQLLVDKAKQENVLDKITILQMDVTSPESIHNVVKGLRSVDVLVNNAGFAQGGFCEELSLGDYRFQFETNFFGVISVTQAIIPLMRKQGSGRIINISSISGKLGFPGLSPYTSSKHALEGLSESLRLELKPFGIHVVLIEPGSYKTNIWAGISAARKNSQSPYGAFMKGILKNISESQATHGEPTDVAKLISIIATQKKAPRLRYPIGKGIRTTLVLKTVLPWKMLEKFVLKKLL